MDKDKAIKDIAIRLKIARIECGFKTSKDFAKYANVAPSTYSQHETLKRSLSLENLLHYSSILDINPGWVITGRGSPIEKISDDNFKEKRICDKVREMEAKGLIASSKAPIIEEDKKISLVESNLFKKVLINMIPLVKEYQNNKTNEEIIGFFFEIYNAIVMSNVEYDQETKKEMIRLCIASFFKGMAVRELDKVLEKVTVA